MTLALNFQYLSHPITRNTPSYGDRDRILVEQRTSLAKGESTNSYKIEFPTLHIGTHIDLPYHFFEGGERIGDVSAGAWVFQAVELVDIPCNTARLLEPEEVNVSDSTELLLLRTGFEGFRGTDKYWNDNPGLSSRLAVHLRRNFPKLRCIGIDAISITSWKYRQEGKEAHRSFLDEDAPGSPIWLIEDMSLAMVKKMLQLVIALPLMVPEADASAVCVIGGTP